MNNEKLNIIIDGQEYDCYPSSMQKESEPVQEEPKEDERLTWRSAEDSGGDFMRLETVGLNPDKVLIGIWPEQQTYHTAPQLYAAALAFVRAGMALDGYVEEINTLKEHLHVSDDLQIARKGLQLAVAKSGGKA